MICDITSSRSVMTLALGLGLCLAASLAGCTPEPQPGTAPSSAASRSAPEASAAPSQNGNTFRIDGQGEGLADGTVITLSAGSPEAPALAASAAVQEGRFALAGRLSEPMMAQLQVGSGDGPSATFVLGSEPISVQASAREVRVSGGAIQTALYGYLQSPQYLSVRAEADALQAEPPAKGAKAAAAREARALALEQRANELVSAHHRRAMASLQTPPLAKLWVLQETGHDYLPDPTFSVAERLAYYPAIAQALGDQHPLLNKLRQADEAKQARLRAAALVAVGQMAPDVALQDEAGNTVRLLDEVKRHRLTMIDFWASWCVPCIEDMPHLDGLRKAYQGKGFQVIGISIDEDRDAWLQAYNKHRPSWLNLLDAGEGRPTSAAKLYGIVGAPTAFLIDGSGKVVGGNLHGSELDAFVADYFAGAKPKPASP